MKTANRTCGLNLNRTVIRDSSLDGRFAPIDAFMLLDRSLPQQVTLTSGKRFHSNRAAVSGRFLWASFKIDWMDLCS
jgi:hypothetical protein